MTEILDPSTTPPKRGIRPAPVRDAAIARYRAGEKVSRIAAECGVSPDAVRYWLRQAGVQLTPSEADRTAALAMVTAGMSQAEVARRLGVHKHTVYRWCRAARRDVAQ